MAILGASLPLHFGGPDYEQCRFHTRSRGIEAGRGALNERFLEEAHRLWRMGEVPDANESFQVVFDGIGTLQGVHSKAQLDIENIESVFAAFEMAKTLNKFADYPPEKIGAFAKAMKSVIVKTIENTLLISAESHLETYSPPPYGEFATLIKKLMSEAQPKETIAVLSFNYDMAVDYAFYKHDIPIDYALGDQPADGGIPVLKLHGSLNWAHCKGCDAIVAWGLNSFFHEFPPLSLRDEKGREMKLPIGSKINCYAHCEGADVESEPILVPPTWNKTEYHSILSSVWSRAAKELGEAENIFVIGYSLPPSDTFFKYLYALGTVSKVTLRRFWVFNPDDTGAVEEKFTNLLGLGALEHFDYKEKTFEQAITIIEEEFIR